MTTAAVATIRASAPGRINLIGEDTDYNGGFVLPVPLPLRVQVTLARRDDRTARVRSASYPDDGLVEYRVGEESRRGHWSDYVAGATATLAAAGLAVGGFAARIESALPPGAGLSSSAAVTVAVLRGLREAFELPVDDVALALMAHRAEYDFVGAPVGLMDPMAVSLGRPGHALFLDTRNLIFEHVAIPAAAAIAVLDSGIAHRNAGGGYASRRAECEAAARALGVPSLREATLATLETASLPGLLDRRVRHVVTENDRVLEMTEALRAGDLSRCGALLQAAHASLRDDFEVSLPKIDAIVEAACEDPAVYGARLTGGGSVIVLMCREAGSPAAVARRCGERVGARVLITDLMAADAAAAG